MDIVKFPFEAAAFVFNILLASANALFPAIFLILSVILVAGMWWWTHFWKRSRISWQLIYFCIALIFPISLFAHSLNNIFRFVFSQIGHVFILIDVDILLLNTILDSFPFIMVLLQLTMFVASLIYIFSGALPAHFGQILTIAQFMFFLLYSVLCIGFKFSSNLFQLLNFEFPTISLILFIIGYIVATIVFLLPLACVMFFSIIRLKMNVVDAFLTCASLLFLIILFGLWTSLSLGLDILSSWLISYVSLFGSLIVEIFKVVPALFSLIKLLAVAITCALIELVFLYLVFVLSERFNKNKRAPKKPKQEQEPDQRLKDQKIEKPASNPSTPVPKGEKNTPKTPIPSGEGIYADKQANAEASGMGSEPSSDPFSYNFVPPAEQTSAANMQPTVDKEDLDAFYADEKPEKKDITNLEGENDFDNI